MKNKIALQQTERDNKNLYQNNRKSKSKQHIIYKTSIYYE